MGQILREVWPFLIGLVVALVLITYVPAISLVLPRLMGF
jgi:C4-dicarboxylate transporter, DctM subunit